LAQLYDAVDEAERPQQPVGKEGRLGSAAPLRRRQTSLRVTERIAAEALQEADGHHGSFTHLVGATRYQHVRNERELMTLARVLDVLRDELGKDKADRLDSVEVLVRRFHAVQLADRQPDPKKAWMVASKLEEVPSGPISAPFKVLEQAHRLARLDQLIGGAKLDSEEAAELLGSKKK
jgi:hypothetical protein